LSALFTPGRGGVWTQFDVDEPALVTLVRQVDGQLDVVQAGSTASDKAAFATGDGQFRFHTQAEAVLVASSERPVDNLDQMVAASRIALSPIDELAARSGAANASSDVELWHRIP
jgi:hypothetical protein